MPIKAQILPKLVIGFSKKTKYYKRSIYFEQLV